MTAREEIQECLEVIFAEGRRDLTSLREASDFLDDLVMHYGPHPMVVEALRKISKLICYLEVRQFPRGD